MPPTVSNKGGKSLSFLFEPLSQILHIYTHTHIYICKKGNNHLLSVCSCTTDKTTDHTKIRMFFSSFLSSVKAEQYTAALNARKSGNSPASLCAFHLIQMFQKLPTVITIGPLLKLRCRSSASDLSIQSASDLKWFQIKGTDLRWQTRPKTQILQKIADFHR